MEPLIAEDLLLLLLDDESGTAPGMWVDAGVPLAAAVLAELAAQDAVALEPAAGLRGARLVATGRAVDDPLLQRVLAVVAEKPRSPTSVVQRTGSG